jgi:hypothetical protein
MHHQKSEKDKEKLSAEQVDLLEEALKELIEVRLRISKK